MTRRIFAAALAMTLAAPVLAQAAPAAQAPEKPAPKEDLVSPTKGEGVMKGQMLDPPIKIIKVERVN